MRQHTLGLSLAAISVLAAACGGDGSAPTSPNGATPRVSLSFSTAATGVVASGSLVPSPAGAVLPPVRGDLTIASGSDTLVITSAQIVLSHVELASNQTTSCDDDASRGCEAFEHGAVLVNLPVDPAVTTSTTTGIPPGTYTALEARLAVPQTSDAGGAALLAAHPEFAGSSVRVTGTFRGAPFVFSAPVAARLELTFSPPLVVDATTSNLTVGVSIDGWFRSASGSLIDPASAAPGGPNAPVVAANVAQSFRAFRDDGRDGHDDHGADDGHGHGHDG